MNLNFKVKLKITLNFLLYLHKFYNVIMLLLCSNSYRTCTIIFFFFKLFAFVICKKILPNITL